MQTRTLKGKGVKCNIENHVEMAFLDFASLFLWYSLEEVSRREALQSFAQSVLDSTYHSECQLVERGFPPDDAHGQMRDIIG